MWGIFFPGFILLLATITCITIWIIDGLGDAAHFSEDDLNGPHDPFF